MFTCGFLKTPGVDAVDFQKKKSGKNTRLPKLPIQGNNWMAAFGMPEICWRFVGDAKIDYDESTPMVESKVKRHMNNKSKDRHADWTKVVPTQHVNMSWIVGCF